MTNPNPLAGLTRRDWLRRNLEARPRFRAIAGVLDWWIAAATGWPGYFWAW